MLSKLQKHNSIVGKGIMQINAQEDAEETIEDFYSATVEEFIQWIRSWLRTFPKEERKQVTMEMFMDFCNQAMDENEKEES